MNITKRLTTVNFTKGGNKKIALVIHTMVGTLDGTDSWFKNKDAQASSHYGIDLDGSRVFQWVEEGDQAYAQGVVSKPTFRQTVDRPGVNPNTYCISIECADNGNPAGADRSKQLPVLVQLVKDICQRNGIPIDRDHICGHREIRSTKTCPGNLDVDEIVRLASVNMVDKMAWVKGYFTEKGINLENEGEARGKLGEVFDGAKKYIEAEKARDKALRDLAEARGDLAKMEENYMTARKENAGLQEEISDLRKQVIARDTQISGLEARVSALEAKVPAPGTVLLSSEEYAALKTKAFHSVSTKVLLNELFNRIFKRG